ncbi:MAG TPA: TIM barrel protein [Phycisphaerales bacterium]|nr:TIM barrel protein [Phycisphaerales bacterium]
MLLTLTVTDARPFLATRRSSGKPDLHALPAIVGGDLGLHGLNLSTGLLVGAEARDLERLRDSADKARCSCLVLIEPRPLAFASLNEDEGEKVVERAKRVLQAGAFLGCNAVSVCIQSDASEESEEVVAERLRPVVERAEKLEINLALAPAPGLTAEPVRLTELIKSVGGFRIGTMPDFQTAVASGDAVSYLRRLTPYAAAVSASTVTFAVPTASKPRKNAQPEPDIPEEPPPPEHTAYALEPMVRAVLSVGFDGNLAVEYRGGGDATLGVKMSRAALVDAIRRAVEA